MKELQSHSRASKSVEKDSEAIRLSVGVLLVEQDPETISVLSLCLSEIRECKLEVSSSNEEALLRISEDKPDLILLAHGLLGKDSIETINEIHHRYPSIYLIVSLPAVDRDLVNRFMTAGVHDCLNKDGNYIPNLMTSVKKALIRIAERDEFDLPALSSVERLAMDEHLPDIIFSLDLEGRILHVNRAIGPLLGYDQKDVLNRNLIEYLSEGENQRKFQTYLEQCPELINFRDTLGFINSLGLEESFEVNCTVMEGEMIYGVLRKERLAAGFEQVESQTIRKEIVMPEDQEQSREPMPSYLGPYRVVTLLGAGAMGRVYEGFDDQLERRVAIKVIDRSRSDQTNIERFRQEAKILASISHPNIAHIYYYGEWEGLPFFCLEYLPGGSVENQLRKCGTLSWEAAMSCIFQVALGLKEAWQKGVIHMDVKPSNLMLSENHRIKIVDFGLSRRAHDEGDADLIVGTPLYVAPEQITGEKTDHRCDIYSLGITFFEMLYGFIPFTGGTVREIFSRKLRETLPDRDTLDPSVPGALYDLTLRMTAIDPDQRINDYSSLIAELIHTRKSLLRSGADVPVTVIGKGEVLMRGSIYETPVPEILGKIWQQKLSGKLTFSWLDLHKTLHFSRGKLTAALSSEEGETLIDVLMTKQGMQSLRSRSAAAKSSDLFLNYSAMLEEFSLPDRKKIVADIQQLAWQILERLFSWVMGEFIFEQGNFPQQLGLEIDVSSVIYKGAKNWCDSAILKRRLQEGKCMIELQPNYLDLLGCLDLEPSDRFLLFRIEKKLSFGNLLQLAGIAEEEFYRLIYLFYSLGLIAIVPPEEHVTIKPRDLAPPPVPAQPIIAHPPEPPAPQPEPPAPQPEPPAPEPTMDLGLYYFHCAEKSFAEKNYWAAVEYCKKAIQTKEDWNTYRLMGQALATHPAFRHEALAAFKKAAELEPDNPLIEREMADLYYANGDYALARSKYHVVSLLDPTDADAAARLKELKTLRK